VIDITRDKPEIVREGAVSRGEVEEALGRAVRAKAWADRGAK
jgi:tRNA A37 threonylcarbamoyladenosine synthetase subunit TsaC/SUA5/YrdC